MAKAAKSIIVRMPKATKVKRRVKVSAARDPWVPAIAAYVLGMIDKEGTDLPTIAVLGRAGTLGAAAYLYSKHSKSRIAGQLAVGFLSVAAYQLAKDDKIAGAGGAFATM